MPNPNPDPTQVPELELKIDAIAGEADDEQWLSVEQIKALGAFVRERESQAHADGEREGRKEQLMEDFLSLSLEFDIDESKLIDWREYSLAQLQSDQQGEQE